MDHRASPSQINLERISTIESFYKEGACNTGDGRNVGIFFADEFSRKDIVTAKAICNGCSVMDKCLNYALDNEEYMGIWGGKTSKEREPLRRLRRRKLRLAQRKLDQ